MQAGRQVNVNKAGDLVFQVPGVTARWRAE